MVQQQVSRAEVGLRSSRGPILLSMMLSVGLVAIDSTILATAVPSIVGDLGGFHQFPWLFSIFLLAQAVSVPIYAKFSDQYGRKPIMLIGVGLFLLGSILCGIAWSMPALIVFRGAAGPGRRRDHADLDDHRRRPLHAGRARHRPGLHGQRLGDLRRGRPDPRRHLRRGRSTGAGSSSSTSRWPCSPAGPCSAGSTRTSSGYATASTSRGAILLTAGSSLLILGLLEGGVLWPWASLGQRRRARQRRACCCVGFALAERRASEPIIPGWIFRARLLNTTNLVSLAVGAMLVGLTSYVPLYVQGVLGHNALVGGFAVAALTIGWPIAAATAGRVYLRIGFRYTALIGSRRSPWSVPGCWPPSPSTPRSGWWPSPASSSVSAWAGSPARP